MNLLKLPLTENYIDNRTKRFVFEFRNGDLTHEQIIDILMAIVECCTGTEEYEESIEYCEFVKKLIEATTWLDIYAQC